MSQWDYKIDQPMPGPFPFPNLRKGPGIEVGSRAFDLLPRFWAKKLFYCSDFPWLKQIPFLSSLYGCMVNVKLKYNFVEIPRKFA